MNKFYIYAGIILMTISFFIPTIMKSEASFVLNNNTFLTIFSVLVFTVLVFFLQRNYYSKHADLVEKANSKIPRLF